MRSSPQYQYTSHIQLHHDVSSNLKEKITAGWNIWGKRILCNAKWFVYCWLMLLTGNLDSMWLLGQVRSVLGYKVLRASWLGLPLKRNMIAYVLAYFSKQTFPLRRCAMYMKTRQKNRCPLPIVVRFFCPLPIVVRFFCHWTWIMTTGGRVRGWSGKTCRWPETLLPALIRPTWTTFRRRGTGLTSRRTTPDRWWCAATSAAISVHCASPATTANGFGSRGCPFRSFCSSEHWAMSWPLSVCAAIVGDPSGHFCWVSASRTCGFCEWKKQKHFF